jgi:hypothetical protein
LWSGGALGEAPACELPANRFKETTDDALA